MDRATAGDIARLRVPVISADEPVERARELADANQWDMAVVVSDRGIERWLDRDALRGEGPAGGGSVPVVVPSTEDVDRVAARLDREGADRALVTDDDELIGVVFRQDIEGRARAAAEGEQRRAPDVGS